MRQLILGIILLLPMFASAAIDTYEFKDEVTRERFQQLVYELRCPKCQNQNLADSNSPIASDLRREIHRMLQEGSDNAEIIDFMVARYGDFVLYRPPVSPLTYLLWYGPFGLLVIGIIAILLIARSKRKVADQADEQEDHLSQSEAQRLQDILEQDTKK